MPPSQQTNDNLSELPNTQQTYLIKGDLSGIQNFVFNVNSKGAARSLKGRSFFLKILLELGMQMIFDAYKIKDINEIEASKISTSGGNFILQLTLNDTTLIDSIQQRLTTTLQYTGLNIILVYTKMQGNYQETLIALNQRTRERKYSLLQNNFQLFSPFDRNEIIQANDNSKWQKITNQLRKASHFNIISIPNTNNLNLKIQANSIHLAGYQIVFGDSGIELSKYLESIFPISNGQPTLFEELVKSDFFNYRTKELIIKGGKEGISKLGVLTLDVDNLGVVLEGVNSREEHKSFDIELQKFFNHEVAKIINTYQRTITYKENGQQRRLEIDKYKNRIYVVTAGGDDSFFVGKWNTLLDLSIDIRNAFERKFNHKGLSISGAIVIVNANFPIVRFASMAEDALKDAKYKYDKKGNISLFGEVLDWDILRIEINDLRKEFGYRKDLISSGLLAKARQAALRIAEDKGIRLSDFWQMGYFMRNTSSTKGRDKQVGSKILKKFRQYLDRSLSETDPVKKRSYRLIFPIAARLAEFDNRKN